MARTSSTGTRKTAAQKRAEAEALAAGETQTPEAPAAEVTAQTDFDSTLVEPEVDTTEAHEEASNMSDTTVESEVVETPVSDTTEAPVATETPAVSAEDEAAKAAAEAKAEQDLVEYSATVDTALAERDNSTGTVPEVNIEAVKTSYRGLNGAKYKTKGKNLLTDKLREAIAGQDIILGTAIMALTDAVLTAGPAPRQAAPAKALDPAAAYRDKMTVLHLAYALGRSHAPEGVDADAEMAKVEEKVNELTDSADAYYTWATNTSADKGDAPADTDQLVIKAVKASQLKAAGSATRSASTGTSTPREPGAARRNVRTHIAQVFDKLGKGAGEILKVAEIAKESTDEYPAADCSPGAISAALKSDKGVPGFELAADESGHTAAKKL